MQVSEQGQPGDGVSDGAATPTGAVDGDVGAPTRARRAPRARDTASPADARTTGPTERSAEPAGPPTEVGRPAERRTPDAPANRDGGPEDGPTPGRRGAHVASAPGAAGGGGSSAATPGRRPRRASVPDPSGTRPSARGRTAGLGDDVSTGPALETRNEVVLVGRVAAPAEERTLPSGDVIATWRLVVDRPPGQALPEGVRRTPVDTLDCVAWTAKVRRTARALEAGDVAAVSGALRRRFWRAGPAVVSRCEVEVATLTRLRRAPRAVRRPGGPG